MSITVNLYISFIIEIFLCSGMSYGTNITYTTGKKIAISERENMFN